MHIESVVTKETRAMLKHQLPLCIWFTGLSGAGKSTLATLLESYLTGQKKHTYLLDGDTLRLGLNKDLGFSLPDRSENIRRVAEVSRLMVDAGLIVIAAFISPVLQDRMSARQLFKSGEFIEIFVNTPLAECERRDVKGLYSKARAGEVKNFTGIDSPYEISDTPELILDTLRFTPHECLSQIIEFLESKVTI